MAKRITCILNSEAERWLPQTVCAVEADSFSQHALWGQYASDSVFPPMYNGKRAFGALKWEQLNPGATLILGHIGSRPVNLSLTWARIEGQLVMFWYGCSQVFDSVMAEKWLDKHFDRRSGQHDAMNFHNAIIQIKRVNENNRA